ncbi:MAG: alpha-galactosidase [Rhodospirillales bacterium]|nr:alpha-galactosidase [Rhodospirillales bacterium]
MSTNPAFSFNPDYSITVARDGRSYTLRMPGLTLPACRIRVASDILARAYATGITLADSRPGRARLTACSPLGGLTLDIRATRLGRDPALVFTLTLASTAPHRWVSIAPLAGVTLRRATHLLTHGRSMGGCHLWALPDPDADPTFTSHFQCVASLAQTRLHLSHRLRQKHVSSMTGALEGTTVSGLEAATRFEFPAARQLVAETLTLAAVRNGHDAMIAWGDAQAGAPLPETQPVGWNSWDYYRWTVSEDAVLANAEFIASDPVLSKHVRRIIVDDGWQYCYGEWDANSLFPGGMAALARKLRKMRFIPGLWMCPTVAEPHSRIAQWHTHMLARSEGGDPCLCFECMRRFGFIIDPTRADSKRWLYDLFHRYVEMGYGYFKIDFLAQTLKAPRFHRNVPRATLMREVITPIRRAIDGRAALLGCGYVYDGGNDLVQMVRAGSDIHATWNETRKNAVSLAARFWASNRVWITDPDFAVCRGPDTSKDPDRGRLRGLYVFVKPDETGRTIDGKRYWSEGFDSIRHHEAQVLLSLVTINGGAVNLSDNLPTLNERGLDLLRRTVAAPRGGAPLPLDLFETTLVSRWLQPTPAGFRTLLINWGETEQELTLDLATQGIHAVLARNFWTDEHVRITGNRVRARLAPHSCQMLEIDRRQN